MRSHTSYIESALSNSKAAIDPIVASWQRSKLLHNLNPEQYRTPERLSNYEFNQAREKIGALIHIANPKLDRLYLALASVGCCVLLSDAKGVPVARRGAEPDDKTFNEFGLWTGALWSEDSEGTNGIGTCIVEERALTIHKGQHFHSKNTEFSCSAAPIFDHDGKLIGALDVSSYKTDLTSDFSKLIEYSVIGAARRIEAENFCRHFASSKIILPDINLNENSLDNKYQGASLLAIDGDDMVIGATRKARHIYGLGQDGLKTAIPLSSLNGQDIDEASQYIKSGQRAIKQALARSKGNISQAAISMGISRATLHRKIKRFKLDG
ncbi:MAG: GAF domain-containing protein [Devosiaceae bacterium]|nr:GAF domain-containing protein [Devosiaceae bacterium]